MKQGLRTEPWEIPTEVLNKGGETQRRDLERVSKTYVDIHKIRKYETP